MADTPQVTPGPQTSEFKIASVATVLGIIGAVAPPLWVFFSDISTQFPQVRLLATIASGVGMLVTVLASLGYSKSRATVKSAALSATKAGLIFALLAAAPARADGPLSWCLSGCDKAQKAGARLGEVAAEPEPPDLSLHLNATVPALAYSLGQKKIIGQLQFGLAYVLDWKEKLCVGAGGSYIQSTGDATITAMLGGPVLPWKVDTLKMRPAFIYERLIGSGADNVLAGTLSFQF